MVADKSSVCFVLISSGISKLRVSQGRVAVRKYPSKTLTYSPSKFNHRFEDLSDKLTKYMVTADLC